ncbi:tRNA (adenosine(37)-N6)-threonylcarbamoyltransferase complex dimerization subunit type 1 TsaB [Bombilactobacillus bombi]|uniref:tRNA (Adenosine(37)-N6)-threonylcarbamoyltransferase complex dimerization subunit type 1 TsaB n=1 Tax=Bombilactobacillus bombi TaxID=1303590 RepID=A0A3R6XWR8_9LACO|nr:tRNA (adenosine(37)-N6)-threonylcarbamoyltransferase complex dimerization subunit type 1 TsaB [Bombilactobacillus bombi]RHW51814.1 tRNA (adenosine(37)-N6)-threonylcarbamoyltransferase complex dimerization subunit type 1 TsaB [Bombilactobacillus bombi]
MKLLAIDTSNAPLIVAAAQNKQILAQTNDTNQKAHSTNLMPAIDQVTKKAGWQPQDIDRVVVAQGPGSFTGVRIAVTVAKMLAWTLDKELVGVSSLAALARNVHDTTGLIVPLFDARHQNVFAGVYQNNQEQLVSQLIDQHIALESLLSYLQKQTQPIYFLGTGAQNYHELITATLGSQAIILNEVAPQASSLVELGLNQQPVLDLDAFSPTYLRQTQAEMVWAQAHPHSQSTNYVEDV